ncbi:hypothetical protein Agub_g2726 [Astrephomene gubernaculifera]|uniref:3'-5' exonuclease domain-containing protein n=1 Tax=Astrephomene gubernaculifera TaxID=47775 RepID=A0AAD3DJN5_9CHLO|nr:hypothetical protein Agub_g2726 [Astrephomene gubernaculifera]
MWELWLAILGLLSAIMRSIGQQLERLASSLMRGKLGALAPSGEPALAYGIAQLVDSVPSLEHMLRSLAGAKQLAVDAEGISLGRTGKLCLLSVSPSLPPDSPPGAHPPVFLLDVSTLAATAFTHTPPPLPRSYAAAAAAGTIPLGATATAVGTTAAAPGPAPSSPPPPPPTRSLQGLLECEGVTKLFYDVRADSEALFHQHGVRLRGVVDLQLSEVAFRRYGPSMRRVGYVVGLARALEWYLDAEVRERWRATAVDKRLLHATYNTDPTYWDRRPLTEEQVRYASDDVLYLHHLHRQFNAALAPAILQRVARFSEYRVTESQQQQPPQQQQQPDGTGAEKQPGAAAGGPGAAAAGGAGGGGNGDPSRALAPPGL